MINEMVYKHERFEYMNILSIIMSLSCKTDAVGVIGRNASPSAGA